MQRNMIFELFPLWILQTVILQQYQAQWYVLKCKFSSLNFVGGFGNFLGWNRQKLAKIVWNRLGSANHMPKHWLSPKHLLRQNMVWGKLSVAGGKSQIFPQTAKAPFLKPFASWERRPFWGKGTANFRGKLSLSAWRSIWPFPLEGNFCPIRRIGYRMYGNVFIIAETQTIALLGLPSSL